MIFLYIVLAVFLQVLYITIAAKVFDFFASYFVLRRGGVHIPIKALMVYLTFALFFFTMFHILAITFVFVVLE